MSNLEEYSPKKLLMGSYSLQGILAVTANEAVDGGLYIAVASLDLERMLRAIGNFSSELEKNLSAVKEELIMDLMNPSNHTSDQLYPQIYGVMIVIDPSARIACNCPYAGSDWYPLGAIRSREEFCLSVDRIIEGYFLHYHSQHKAEIFRNFLERSTPLGHP